MTNPKDALDWYDKHNPMEQKLLIKRETEGFDEAKEEIEMLAEAYDGFPAQVTIRNCQGCNIYVYPTQVQQRGTRE